VSNPLHTLSSSSSSNSPPLAPLIYPHTNAHPVQFPNMSDKLPSYSSQSYTSWSSTRSLPLAMTTLRTYLRTPSISLKPQI
jgi:hypothetical protein